MRRHPAPNPGTHTGTLARLAGLRWMALAAMAATMAWAAFGLRMELPLPPLALIVCSLVLLNLRTAWRTRHPRPVSHAEVLGHLLADVAALALVLYFTGGWANPFVSLFLLPVVIGATVLPAAHAGGLALATLAAYTTLGFHHVPLPHLHHEGGTDDFDLHLLGMWASFVLSAGVVAGFVVRLSASLRARDRELAEARERALRDQHVLALGTLAAGAAHRLGTPLGTMAVLLKDMAADAPDPAAAADLSVLRTQVEACKGIVSDLLASAGRSRPEDGRAETVDRFLVRTVEAWQALRPGVRLHLKPVGPVPGPTILADRSLGDALQSLLDNAADASPDGIEMEARWSGGTLVVEIRDRGQGVPEHVLARAGLEATSTKPDGHGVGLMIASSALERFGGRVRLRNRGAGGACTVMELPLGGLVAG